MKQKPGPFEPSGPNMPHLGTVVCRHCGEIIDTLPTDGVKLFYGECASKTCSGAKGVREDDCN